MTIPNKTNLLIYLCLKIFMYNMKQNLFVVVINALLYKMFVYKKIPIKYLNTPIYYNISNLNNLCRCRYKFNVFFWNFKKIQFFFFNFMKQKFKNQISC